MDPPDTGHSRAPLGDCTNTIIQGELDPNARKRQKEKERYASMSREQKDERMRKQRERRRAQKGPADENAPNDNAENENSPIGNEDPNCTRTVDLDPTERKKQMARERYASMSREEKDERNRKQRERRRANKLMANQNAQVIRHEEEDAIENELHLSSYNNVVHVETSNHGIHVTAGEGGNCTVPANRMTEDIDLVLRSGQDNFVDIPHTYVLGGVVPKDGDDGVNCGQGTPDDNTGSWVEQHMTPIGQRDESGNNDKNVDDGEGGGDCTCPTTRPTEERGAGNGSCFIDDHNTSPNERRRRQDRAQRAAMSPMQRSLINKRRREARAANASKRLFLTPQEKVERKRQSQRNYKLSVKEQRANNLHPDSVAMANPQFKPELVFPHVDKPTSSFSEEMEIPEFGGTPVYVVADVQEHPQQVETPATFLSNTIHTSHLTPGLRHSRRKHRNQEFEATIERNTRGTTDENDNVASQPTQSYVVDNGVTQNYPRRDGTSDVYGAGTSGHAPHNEKCTQTQPSVVDEHGYVPPHVLHRRYPREDGDDNIVFDEDEEADEGYLFAGQEDDNDDAVVDVDLARGDEEAMDTDAPDPFGAVYGNVPDEGHTLKPVDNCEFCNAKKFEYEPPGFCCRSGAIHLSTPDTPPEELV